MKSYSVNDTIHSKKQFKKGSFFQRLGRPCVEIGLLEKGVMRGFVTDNDGNEITTHFYQEGDLIIGSFLPNTNVSMNIEALLDCKVSIANFSEVMSYVNKDIRITEVINKEFQNLNDQLQSRLVSLLNLTSIEKYTFFIEKYPSLVNRVPLQYIANYLGITPTQLSRARKSFTEKR